MDCFRLFGDFTKSTIVTDDSPLVRFSGAVSLLGVLHSVSTDTSTLFSLFESSWESEAFSSCLLAFGLSSSTIDKRNFDNKQTTIFQKCMPWSAQMTSSYSSTRPCLRAPVGRCLLPTNESTNRS